MDTENLQTLEQAKKELTKQAYGSEKASAINEIRHELAKSIFEARKAQLKAQKPVYEKRKELVKDVKDFWPQAFTSSQTLGSAVEEADIPALKHLTDLSVTYSEDDPREFSITFTFSENPYFSETTLTKSFKVAPEIKKEHPFALEVPLVSDSVAITWKSDAKNLVKKSPRPDISKLEEYDEFDGTGSFFTFFTEQEDLLNLNEVLQQFYEGAHDTFAGIDQLEGEDGDDDDEDDEEDEEDDEEEVDLGDSETDMPKKKKQKSG